MVDKELIKKQYKKWVDEVCEDLEDKTYFTIDEIVDKVTELTLKQVKNNDSLHSVSKCACPPLVACEICGEEKNLYGDFWKNKKKHDC